MALCGALALLIASVCLYYHLPDYSSAIEEQRSLAGHVVSDRKGRVLRLLPDARDRFNLWIGIDTFPRSLKAAVVAAEDKRFFYHFGFDPVAAVRALVTNVRRWKTVSGASTITQQVVRLIRPRPRTYWSKITETVNAVKMERQLSKDQIFELYLNLSPFGGNIRGAGLAARIYFGKDVKWVSVSEAAVLAVLPRSPSRYDPRRLSARGPLLVQKSRIIEKMAEQGLITPEQLQASLTAQVDFKNLPLPMEAPHFSDHVAAVGPLNRDVVKTTLDLDVQQAVEQCLASHRNRLRKLGIEQAAALVASTRGPDVIAMAGSLKYGARGQGFNNAVFASRGAGSTLKPFLYALALESGYYASAEIADTFRSYPTPFGDYLPFNVDRRMYGPVNVRLALGNSLNIPAVKIVNALGVNEFYRSVQQLRLTDDNSRSADFYGLGLAIGNMEVTLFRLVQAYAMLAREGEFRPLRLFQGEESRPLRVYSPEVAYIISHILADPSARLLTFGNPDYFDFGFPVSVKTGTSSNQRDAWVIGYTPDYVIGLWAGNFDGRPTGGAGAGACGPILKQLIRTLYGSGQAGVFRRPAGVREVSVCSMSGQLAGSNCPHKSRELLTSRSVPRRCAMAHDDEHHPLGSPYASWLSRREKERTLGRFRLMAPLPGIAGRPAGKVIRSSEVRSRTTAGASGIEILSPHNFDHFVLSPYHTNRVLLRAQPESVVEHVVWFVDGVEIARTAPPYELFWDPTRGRHVIHAATPANTAAQVIIHVE